MFTDDSSRIPLSVNAALRRMNLPAISGNAAASVQDFDVQRLAIEDYCPLSESLEWRIAEAHWDSAGVLPFVGNEVPFLINNSGRLSADLATLFVAHCREAGSLPRRLRILELGAGTGLFARYFLDSLRDQCRSEGTDFYDRLTYVVTDRSQRSVDQWGERGLFDVHGGHVELSILDPARDDPLPQADGEFRVVFCNYLLDVLPSTVVRRGVDGPEELRVRTQLATDPGFLLQFTRLGADEIAARASSGRQQDLLELGALLPALELDLAFRPLAHPQPSMPFLMESLEAVPAGKKLLLNFGALRMLLRLFESLPRDGFVLVNDYGPVEGDQVDGFCALHRFGPSVAFGINFVELERFSARRGIQVSKPAADAGRDIHTRLLSRSELPATRAAFDGIFSSAAHERHEEPVERARAHVAAGRLNEALEAYREAVMRDPRNWYLLGEAGEFLALQLRSHEPAVDLVRAAVALNPCYSAWLWNVLGDSLYCLDRYEDAHEAYLQAARIDPDDVRTNLNLAYTLAHFGRLAEALAAVARGLACDRQEAYGARLLEKQRHILALNSTRWRSEQERLARRAARFQSA